VRQFSPVLVEPWLLFVIALNFNLITTAFLAGLCLKRVRGSGYFTRTVLLLSGGGALFLSFVMVVGLLGLPEGGIILQAVLSIHQVVVSALFLPASFWLVPKMMKSLDHFMPPG